MMRCKLLILTGLLGFTFSVFPAKKQQSSIKHNLDNKTIILTVPGKKLSVTIDYSTGCVISALAMKGKQTLSASGIYTAIRTKSGSASSALSLGVKVSILKNECTITGITYGIPNIGITETWRFILQENKIIWAISRQYDRAAELEETDFPKWNFADFSVWKGGIMDNGGMVWCKYLKQVNDTYGVHTAGVTFWNAESGDALRISAKTEPDHQLAASYSRSTNNEFTFAQMVTDTELQQRYDLSRFVAQRADVFAPFKVQKSTIKVRYELQYIDYIKAYSRGTLPGIDAGAVRELMNTTGRYGVVDNRIVGANGWLTNWKCLHEPFFAQIGMALNDVQYTSNMSATLDQERDQAMLKDGRVLSRWHNAAGDEIPGTYNSKTGYYEAMWGYTVDSQTSYVINTAEQFDQTGNINWLKSHQYSCEKALDWLIRRDSNKNGIFEMMNHNVADHKASDWLDIVWASYENAFVNAQLYEALQLWSECEKVLGNPQKATYYAAVAARLKSAFNQPVEEGGFWSADKKQYVYWRDKDGSIHGNNLVTPVNFAAIAFGLCDDPKRTSLILDQIEERTKAENLFHWPLCFDSFSKAEVSEGNWPFPKYENGDIFPTWGYLGVRAYAGYDKTIALKYVNKLLEQYEKDGLSSQRYSRSTQHGLGDDILAGICTSITALYRDIYGIRPKWNRLGILPNMSEPLNGTKFSYTHLGTKYQLDLSVSNYSLSTEGFSIHSTTGFGIRKTGKKFVYYPGNKEEQSLEISEALGGRTDLKIDSWTPSAYSWTVTSGGNYQIRVGGLQKNKVYELQTGKTVQRFSTQADGSILISKACIPGTRFHLRKPPF